MRRGRVEDGVALRLGSGGPGLPAGVRTGDGDGPPDPLARASDRELWNACPADGREAMTGQFIGFHADAMRDAILDAQECSPRSLARQGGVGGAAGGWLGGPVERMRAERMGRAIWAVWVEWRASHLESLRRRGILHAPPDG